MTRYLILFALGACIASFAADAAPFDCNGSSAEVSLARVLTTQARVNFVAGQSLFVCATFVAKGGVATRGLLPRAALQIASPEPASVQQWNGKWRRDEEAEIVIKSHEDELEVTGAATWQSSVEHVLNLLGARRGRLLDCDSACEC